MDKKYQPLQYILLLMISLVENAFAADYFERFKADKITDTLYVVHGPREIPTPENHGFMNNPAFILAADSVVVIDPGSSHQSAKMLLREIKKITHKPVSHIFNTHIHGDHWLGNEFIQQAFPKVKIIADHRMIKKAKAGAAQSWIDSLLRMTQGATAGTKIAYPNVPVKNADSLSIAGLTFNIYSLGKAHSGTDIMIEYVEGSTLFTGDNVGYTRVLRMDDGSFRDNIKALEKAEALNLNYYVPGHGPTGGVEIVQLQKEFFEILYGKVKIYYEQGLEDFEMKPKIKAALAKFKDWAGFDQELGKQISLAKLEIEAAEFE